MNCAVGPGEMPRMFGGHGDLGTARSSVQDVLVLS